MYQQQRIIHALPTWLTIINIISNIRISFWQYFFNSVFSAIHCHGKIWHWHKLSSHLLSLITVPSSHRKITCHIICQALELMCSEWILNQLGLHQVWVPQFRLFILSDMLILSTNCVKTVNTVKLLETEKLKVLRKMWN